MEATGRLNESRDPPDLRNWKDVSTWVWEDTRKTRTSRFPPINHLQQGHSQSSQQAPAICGGGRLGGDFREEGQSQALRAGQKGRTLKTTELGN